MNRYLYKAKRLDNGEWVQGVPFEIEGKQVILIKDNENLLRVHYLEENMWTAEIYAIEVDASTICQCADLKDKKRIKMNKVRFQFHFLIVKFYSSIMSLLYEKCNEHITKAEKILDELERYGA